MFSTFSVHIYLKIFYNQKDLNTTINLNYSRI